MILRKTFSRAIRLFAIAVCTVACSAQPATPLPGEVETVVAVTFAAMTESAPATNATPAATATEVPTAVFVPYTAQTITENVNLRLGPGTLFRVSRVMAQGTTLEVHGRSHDPEWLYVKNDEDIFGWVGINLIENTYAGPTPPFVEPGESYLVTGSVKTELGTSVSGIGFALLRNSGSNPLRSDTVTDQDGRFYAYLPTTLTGTWVIEYVSVACTSNTMDANCNCIGGTCGEADPRSVEISVPTTNELVFVWK
jgi:uncharacterized protein YraI